MKLGRIIVIILFGLFIQTCQILASIRILESTTNSAYLIYKNQTNNKNQIVDIVYRNPIENPVNFTVKLGHLSTQQKLEKWKYQLSVFMDQQRINLHRTNERSVLVNTVCKFDYNKQLAFSVDGGVRCELTMKFYNKIIGKGKCNLHISRTSSVCYSGLEIDLTEMRDSTQDGYMVIDLRIVMSDDSVFIDRHNAARLSFSDIVTVNLYLMGEYLEVAVPAANLNIGKPDVIIIRPTNKLKKITSGTLECQFSPGLILTEISFDASNYEGVLKYNTKLKSFQIEITESKNSRIATQNQGDRLVNLHVRPAPNYKPSKDHIRNERWFRCHLVKANQFGTDEKYIHKDEIIEKVKLKINEDDFIIIPILEKLSIYSILNEPKGPISLSEMGFKLYSVHSERDGSLIDVTSLAKCQDSDNSNIICPDHSKNQKSIAINKSFNWYLTFSMAGWQRLVRVPVEFWQAEDWRLNFVGSKVLKWIKGWRAPLRHDSGSCQMIRQRTRIQLVGRLLMSDGDDNKIYYGEAENDPHPLINFTPYLSSKHVHLSNTKLTYVMKYNHLLLSIKHDNDNSKHLITDISITNDNGQKIVLDRVKYNNEEVVIKDILVKCIHMLNITGGSNAKNTYNWWNKQFNRVYIIESQSSRSSERCYFDISLLFSDGSVTNLMDYSDNNGLPYFRLIMKSNKVEDITALDRFLYVPNNYDKPGQFQLILSESTACEGGGEVIFKKQINLYSGRDISTNVSTTTMKSTPIVTDNKNTIIKVTDDPPPYPGGQKVDTDSLYLGMKILIGLVALVAVIFISNCIIKFRNRKMARDETNNGGGGSLLPVPTMGITPDKLMISTYTPNMDNPGHLAVNNNGYSSNVQSHPPLLPPPGPLYPAGSDSSQLDLATATPDIFWGLPSATSTPKANPIAISNIPNSHVDGSSHYSHISARRPYHHASIIRAPSFRPPTTLFYSDESCIDDILLNPNAVPTQHQAQDLHNNNSIAVVDQKSSSGIGGSLSITSSNMTYNNVSQSPHSVDACCHNNNNNQLSNDINTKTNTTESLSYTSSIPITTNQSYLSQ